MSVLIIGDPHIGGGGSLAKTNLGVGLNSRVFDQLNILDWAIDLAVNEHISNIVLTGDVFDDPKPSFQLIGALIDWVKKCSSYNIYVHIIMGNHDVLTSSNNYISPLDILDKSDIDNLSVYKDIYTLVINSTAFTFLPYRDRKTLNAQTNADGLNLLKEMMVYETSAIPKLYKKVAIGHLAIEGSIPVGNEVDDLMNELFCPIDMFKDYDYVWMGHIHKPQVMSKKPYIAHIGSMDISNYGEAGETKIAIIYNTDTDTFKEVKVPVRQLQKISILIPKDTVDTTKYVEDKISELSELDNSIVKIEVSLESQDMTSIDRQKIEKFLKEKNVYHISAFSEVKKTNKITKTSEKLETSIDTNEAIKKWADLKFSEDIKKNKFIELANSLLKEAK